MIFSKGEPFQQLPEITRPYKGGSAGRVIHILSNIHWFGSITAETSEVSTPGLGEVNDYKYVYKERFD